ncbi:hypothetical protein [Lignipirellula cremea]|uniref:Glycoside hydrolase family 42 N-terminal domain-containing protein n=1 Tax=Lignipirellula cremea TaxID=2528010 RepID=A0A518DMC5_9BACT|nr:hypothetical protein [Lignipirellula cremea]QDU92972.1 hypothetical protein Pla8534_07450 [Lignipirellula cremea]
MHLLLVLLLVSAPPAISDFSESTPLNPESSLTGDAKDLIYACRFDEAADQNYDNWPDSWTRRRGRQYPHYLKIEIDDDPSPAANDDKESPGRTHRALRIQLDGGAAEVHAPPVEISSTYSYFVRMRLRTDRLKHDEAYFSVAFLDQDQRQMGKSHYSSRLTRSQEWTPVQVGPLAPVDPAMRYLRIAVHVHPTAEADLVGDVWCDDVEVIRLPRMSLSTERDHHLFTQAADIAFTCRVSGISNEHHQVQFELLDLWENQVQVVVIPMENDPTATAARKKNSDYAGRAIWQPGPLKNGFYRLRVGTPGESEALQRETTFVLAVPALPRANGEFGWAMPEGEEPFSFRGLSDLLSHVGVHWLKFPCWYSESDEARADQLANFAERLDLNAIRMVGVLDKPPHEMRSLFGREADAPVASLFSDPEVWRPVIDPIMSRLSLKVRWWQLGGDDDASFVGLPELEGKIREIKSRLERFGQEIEVGIVWQWLNEPPATAAPPWEFLSFTEQPSFTHIDLNQYLASAGRQAARWVVLSPLPASEYSLETRARDLVLRMMATRMQNAPAVFISRPLDTEHGLLHPDGSPGPLLLPWRTAALALAGAEYLGTLQLPSGSHNQVFARDGEAIMVVWNESPTREVLYLGESVRQLDVWGGESTPAQEEHRQVIDVGPMPTFLVGLHEGIARWRLSFHFENDRLASVFGRSQTNGYRFTNHFPQGLGGRATLQTPDVWSVNRPQASFKASAGEEIREPFSVLLKNGASSGPQPVRVDFEVTAEKLYRFSVYPTMHVGLGDITLRLQTMLNADGALVVRQQMTNNTDEKVSFNCLMFAPGRRRQRVQVLEQGRGLSTQSFIYPDGSDLLGENLWLRAEEIGGDRILNYHVPVQP